jgi:DNA repair exonuclease SbcCD ATPase subunit
MSTRKIAACFKKKVEKHKKRFLRDCEEKVKEEEQQIHEEKMKKIARELGKKVNILREEIHEHEQTMRRYIKLQEKLKLHVKEVLRSKGKNSRDYKNAVKEIDKSEKAIKMVHDKIKKLEQKIRDIEHKMPTKPSRKTMKKTAKKTTRHVRSSSSSHRETRKKTTSMKRSSKRDSRGDYIEELEGPELRDTFMYRTRPLERNISMEPLGSSDLSSLTR